MDDHRGAWSAAGGVVAALTGSAAIALALAAVGRNSGGLALIAFSGLIAVLGIYWMIAALVPSWPFRNDAPKETLASRQTEVVADPQPSGADIVLLEMRREASRIERMNALTVLVEECKRLLRDLESHGNDWDDMHRVMEWTQRADDTITRELGTPHDTLARNHGAGEPPAHLRSKARNLWIEADRRRQWMLEYLTELGR